MKYKATMITVLEVTDLAIIRERLADLSETYDEATALSDAINNNDIGRLIGKGDIVLETTDEDTWQCVTTLCLELEPETPPITSPGVEVEIEEKS